MTTNETRRYEMLLRVHTFGAAHRDLFPTKSVGGQAFKTVAEAVEQLGEHAVSKQSSAYEGKGARLVARRALIVALEDTRRCARAIAEDTPGFADPFHLARVRTDRTLVTTGLVFVREAEAGNDRFVAYGMPADFVTSLSALVTELDEAISSREEGRDGHAAARANIEAAIASGFAAVRKLDVIVPNTLGGDPAALAVWERDRRIEPPRRARKSRPEAPAVAPAARHAPEAAPGVAPGVASGVAQGIAL